MTKAPIFAAKKQDGSLWWFNLSWGNTWSEGCGYIGMVPWGEKKERSGFCRDNRIMIDPDDCEIELLGWTDETARYEYPRLEIYAAAPGSEGREGS